MTGAGDYAVIQAKRKALIDAIKPDLVTKKQPLLMQYDQLDANGSEIAETLMIQAVYESGLEGDGSGNAYTEKVAINFTSYLPYLQQQGEHGTALGYQESVANADYIVKRAPNGEWSAFTSPPNGLVYTMAEAPDGTLYVAGYFTNLGDANGDYVVKWNGSAWVSLGTGANEKVYALAVGADGTLYAAGNFTLMGGVANTAYIAKWDGSVWTPLSTGANAVVWALAIGQDGALYAGGAFTDLGDANGDRIAKWNGTAWSSLGTGANDTILCLTVSPNGSLYVGGALTSVGGVTVSGIAKWDGAAWSALGSGVAGIVSVYVMKFGPDGNLYAGGPFYSAGGAANSGYIARWDGSAWYGLGSAELNNRVYALEFDSDGLLYIGGEFGAVGSMTIPHGFVAWNGSVYQPTDISLPGSPVAHSILLTGADELYVGYDTTGTAHQRQCRHPQHRQRNRLPCGHFQRPGHSLPTQELHHRESHLFQPDASCRRNRSPQSQPR